MGKKWTYQEELAIQSYAGKCTIAALALKFDRTSLAVYTKIKNNYSHLLPKYIKLEKENKVIKLKNSNKESGCYSFELAKNILGYDKYHQSITLWNKYKMIYHDYIKDYRLVFNSRKNVKRLGCINFTTKVIELSTYKSKFRQIEEIENTILHEIAHAIERAKYKKTGHGKRFKAIYTMICIKHELKPRKLYESNYQIIDFQNFLKGNYSLVAEKS